MWEYKTVEIASTKANLSKQLNEFDIKGWETISCQLVSRLYERFDGEWFGFYITMKKPSQVPISAKRTYDRKEVELLILQAVDDNDGNTKTVPWWIDNNL